MSKLELGRIGIALNVSTDDSHLQDAAEAEDLGYSTIWLPGGQIDRLDRIAKIVEATTTVGVGSAIISTDVHPAQEVVKLQAELQATAPDRFIVGLGGSQKPRSLAALNDYLSQLDEGDPPVPRERRILAALGPRKLELARDRCAGAMTLLVTPAYTAHARQVLGEHHTLIVQQMLVPDTDTASARETARGPLRFLSQLGGYAANFERMGFTDTDISELSDRLVDELVVWGDVDTITNRVRAHLDEGADHVVLSVLNNGRHIGPIEAARGLAGPLLR